LSRYHGAQSLRSLLDTYYASHHSPRVRVHPKRKGKEKNAGGERWSDSCSCQASDSLAYVPTTKTAHRAFCTLARPKRVTSVYPEVRPDKRWQVRARRRSFHGECASARRYSHVTTQAVTARAAC
jgi:hypothetical protein